MKRASFLLCLLAASLLVGCSNPNKDIVGKWQAENSSATWEFFANGTLDNNGTPGRYTFGDNNRLKIQTGAATFVYLIERQGDRLILKDPAGSRLELSRVH